MNTSYLIQRLLKPFQQKTKGISVAEVFAFGGGLQRGGLSKEAWDLLAPIFRFDYMGAAEFEFGAVPETLAKIFDEKDKYESFVDKVKYEYKSWKDDKDYTGSRDIFVICKIEDKEEVLKRIRHFAKNSYSNTKELVCLNESMAEKSSREYIGWLELDNGYMFFIDEGAFRKICLLFQIKEKAL